MKSTTKNPNPSGRRALNDLRRRSRAARKLSTMLVEPLETRQMLTAGVATVATVGMVGPIGSTTIPAALFTPTTTNLLDAQHGPMANFGTQIVSIYGSYAADFAAVAKTGNTSAAAANALAATIAKSFPTVQLSGSSVNLSINSLGGDFNAFVTQLTNLGMQVTDSDSNYGIVEGWVPIAELPTIARLPQTEAGHAIAAATTHALTGFQGVAYDEPETATGADAARSQFGLTGAGVTVGVLSDSVNSVGGGLSDSYNSRDLDPSNPVFVVPGQAGSGSDEGRAMLEGIHDIAPGANLQFATGGPGDLGFMQNIEALYNSGSKIIVDDLSQGDEPYFQDGLIAQGVDYVTSRGDAYFTSAANSGSSDGYLAPFTAYNTATTGNSPVDGMTGVFQTFNAGTAAATPLQQITTGVANSFINFQFDQPFKTQEPAGATATTTSSLSFYVFDSSGHQVLDSQGHSISGTDNNVATQQPYQAVSVPTPGTYYVAIKLVSGTAPGHVEFVGLGDQGALVVNHPTTVAANTYYPSSEGHETAISAIGVAASPWFAPAPFNNLGIATPTESSSSTGPGLIDLTPKGTPAASTLVQNPAITSADGGTTSFFGQGDIDTTLYGGTAFDETPYNQQGLKDFFGTSQAAPNAAAVAALMLQEVPTLSRLQILKALETSATPINNTPAGTYNVQSGYGLINAVAAINAIAPPTTTASTTTASSSTTSPTLGTAFNLIANVAAGGGAATGSVDFYDISYNMDYGTVALAAGSASKSVTVPSTQPGAHVYLLTYTGNGSTATSSAYLVLDVVDAGSGQSFVVHSSKPATSSPTAAPTSTTHAALIPLVVSTPTPLVVSIPTAPAASSATSPETIDDVAIGILSSPSTTGVKKFTN